MATCVGFTDEFTEDNDGASDLIPCELCQELYPFCLINEHQMQCLRGHSDKSPPSADPEMGRMVVPTHVSTRINRRRKLFEESKGTRRMREREKCGDSFLERDMVNDKEVVSNVAHYEYIFRSDGKVEEVHNQRVVDNSHPEVRQKEDELHYKFKDKLNAIAIRKQNRKDFLKNVTKDYCSGNYFFAGWHFKKAEDGEDHNLGRFTFENLNLDVPDFECCGCSEYFTLRTLDKHWYSCYWNRGFTPSYFISDSPRKQTENSSPKDRWHSAVPNKSPHLEEKEKTEKEEEENNEGKVIYASGKFIVCDYYDPKEKTTDKISKPKTYDYLDVLCKRFRNYLEINGLLNEKSSDCEFSDPESESDEKQETPSDSCEADDVKKETRQLNQKRSNYFARYYINEDGAIAVEKMYDLDSSEIYCRRKRKRLKSCWNCGRKANEACSGCNLARYCGAFCQHKDWENHHKACGQGAASHAAVNSLSNSGHVSPSATAPEKAQSKEYLCGKFNVCDYFDPVGSETSHVEKEIIEGCDVINSVQRDDDAAVDSNGKIHSVHEILNNNIIFKSNDHNNNEKKERHDSDDNWIKCKKMYVRTMQNLRMRY